jgi:glycosyltransferase involved in cell wall biosynthesis
MKILFWGGICVNNGPGNINKGIVSNFTDSFLYAVGPNKYLELADALGKLICSDVVVVSGVSRQGAILVRAAKLLGKRSVYLMHGCAEQEYKLNGRKPDEKGLAHEACLMDKTDLILTVSQRYMHWVREVYPRYAEKVDYVYNGVNAEIFCRKATCRRNPREVAVCGGLAPLKNNLTVAKAVEALEGKASLSVYGYVRKPSVEAYRFTEFAGKLENIKFLERLSQSGLFVLNSLLESFSSATLEALACGCSLLVSERAGVCDLLALEETDIIHDPMDVEEIRRKIEYLLEHPNHQRLYDAFDPEEWSFEKMVLRLEEKCRRLIQKN